MSLAAFSDACPECFPGDYPALMPSSVSVDNGKLCAGYRHEECGSEWCTWWDAVPVGWPLRRERRPLLAVLLDELIAVLASAFDHPENSETAERERIQESQGAIHER